MVSTSHFERIYSLGLEGQDQVNRAFGGGLPAGCLAVVEGQYGAGKTTLARRFAYGLCEQNHSVTYLSTEHTLSPFLDQMRSLSYDIQKSLLRRDLLYLFGNLGDGDQDEQPELLSKLQGAQQLWKSDVVVLDTFSDILLYDPTVQSLVSANTQRRAIQKIISFFRQITATGTTIILLISTSGLPEQILEPLRAVGDVLLDISVADGHSQRRREINVRRFAGMQQQIADKIGFSIRPNTGIVISNQSVVKR